MNEKNIMPVNKSLQPPLPASVNPPFRILLTDDNDALRRLSVRVLTRAGYQVDAVEDGAAGWAALQANQYDLLITDHEMPYLTGVELLRKVRAARMALPVIMTTGNWPAQEFARQPALFPAAKLLKPYTVAELLGTVKTVLSETPCGTKAERDRAKPDVI